MQRVTDLLHAAIAELSHAGIDQPRLDAELLLAHVLGRQRSWLWVYSDTPVPADEAKTFNALLQRRINREPLPYILGEWEFYGRGFAVTPAVLIPRPETELLVEAVVEWAQSCSNCRIVDVGVGSGAIAVTLALELPSATLVAIDLSPQAIDVARANAQRHHVGDRIIWIEGDLLHPVHNSLFTPVDVIVANLPYIADSEIEGLMPEVRDFEPRIALAAGEQGLLLIRRLIEQSPPVLRPCGMLALEVGLGQAEVVCGLLSEAGWGKITVMNDYAGIPRHVLAIQPDE